MPAVEEAAATTAAAGFWVDQSAAAASSLSANGAAASANAWQAFTGWYDAAAVAAQAAVVADLSKTAQGDVAGLFTEYVAQVTAALRGGPVRIPDFTTPDVRNGADPIAVHSRPAQEFRVTFSMTGDEMLAAERAMTRARQIIETDLMLAAREAQRDAMDELGVQTYRRVLRPELSQQGPCGLCVVASDQVYKVAELMPIHDRCKCETLPIVAGNDPGRRINKTDLQRIYAAAGDTTEGRDLKRVRVQINEHGELGPVLSVKGQKFKGPEDLGTRDPEQNRRDITKLLGVLDQLTGRQADGEDLQAPLAYQRDRIARLQQAA